MRLVYKSVEWYTRNNAKQSGVFVYNSITFFIYEKSMSKMWWTIPLLVAVVHTIFTIDAIDYAQPCGDLPQVECWTFFLNI